MKGYQRNYPCLCKSGKKWKKCHPEMKGVYRTVQGDIYKGDADRLWQNLQTSKEIKEMVRPISK